MAPPVGELAPPALEQLAQRCKKPRPKLRPQPLLQIGPLRLRWQHEQPTMKPEQQMSRLHEQWIATRLRFARPPMPWLVRNENSQMLVRNSRPSPSRPRSLLIVLAVTQIAKQN